MIMKNRLNHKIREAQLAKIPYMLIIGDKEMESTSVSVRGRGRGDLGRMELEDFANMICKEISDKK